jgi:hypothetical protein
MDIRDNHSDPPAVLGDEDFGDACSVATATSEFDLTARTGAALPIESRAVSSNRRKHDKKKSMFDAVTRGLIRVERRKTFARRLSWRLAMGLYVSIALGGAAFALWQYQPQWAMQWWPTDWPREFLTR